MAGHLSGWAIEMGRQRGAVRGTAGSPALAAPPGRLALLELPQLPVELLLLVRTSRRLGVFPGGENRGRGARGGQRSGEKPGPQAGTPPEVPRTPCISPPPPPEARRTRPRSGAAGLRPPVTPYSLEPQRKKKEEGRTPAPAAAPAPWRRRRRPPPPCVPARPAPPPAVPPLPPRPPPPRPPRAPRGRGGGWRPRVRHAGVALVVPGPGGRNGRGGGPAFGWRGPRGSGQDLCAPLPPPPTLEAPPGRWCPPLSSLISAPGGGGDPHPAPRGRGPARPAADRPRRRRAPVPPPPSSRRRPVAAGVGGRARGRPAPRDGKQRRAGEEQRRQGRPRRREGEGAVGPAAEGPHPPPGGHRHRLCGGRRRPPPLRAGRLTLSRVPAAARPEARPPRGAMSGR